MNQPVLSLRDAAFGYSSSPVLTDVSVDLFPGQALALVGPNGSGKTTLLRAVLGGVRLLSGSMQLGGTRIGYVPQSTDIDLTFPITVKEVVTMGLYGEIGWLRRPRKEHRVRVEEAISRVDMADRINARFGDLSGGQRQRVLLARAQVSRPGLVLLDEPFNGLDEPNRESLVAQMQAMTHEGVAILVSTHDLELAHETCDRALLLAGRQVALGPCAEVLTTEILADAYRGRGDDRVAVLNTGGSR